MGKRRHAQVSELNRKLETLCATNKTATFVDLNIFLAPDGMLEEHYTLDGIHLNGRGYQEWARAISPFVRQVPELNGDGRSE